MDTLKRFMLTLRLRNSKYAVVEQCALFSRVIGGGVVSGFAISNGAVCNHYWVEKDDEVFDVARSYSALFSPELNALTIQLVREIPEGQNVLGADDQETKRNAELYELYCTDPKAFWKQVVPFKKMS